MTSQHGFAPTNGTSLYYEISGAGDPIVLLHGFSFNHHIVGRSARWSQEFITAQGALRAIAREDGVAEARERWLSFPLFEPALKNPVAAPRLRRSSETTPAGTGSIATPDDRSAMLA
jgi:pimeloyl-ACP methyl ester carboxylesterase